MIDLESKLAKQEARLETLRTRAGVARGKAEAHTPGGSVGYDPAVLSGIRRKPDHKKDARRYASYDREAAIWRELVACEAEVGLLKSHIVTRDKNKPIPFTPEELKSARAIRTTLGWHKVAKVNAKSVSVETGYSWTDRYALDKILEVRA